MMDENDYTSKATGIDQSARDQVEAVAALMNATTNRLELSTKRVDSYAKWFACLVTLIVGISTVIIKTQSDRIIAQQDKQIKDIGIQLATLAEENTELHTRLDNINLILREREDENKETIYKLMEQLSNKRNHFE